jgi:hypothetical protein
MEKNLIDVSGFLTLKKIAQSSNCQFALVGYLG